MKVGRCGWGTGNRKAGPQLKAPSQRALEMAPCSAMTETVQTNSPARGLNPFLSLDESDKMHLYMKIFWWVRALQCPLLRHGPAPHSQHHDGMPPSWLWVTALGHWLSRWGNQHSLESRSVSFGTCYRCPPKRVTHWCIVTELVEGLRLTHIHLITKYVDFFLTWTTACWT